MRLIHENEQQIGILCMLSEKYREIKRKKRDCLFIYLFIYFVNISVICCYSFVALFS